MDYIASFSSRWTSIAQEYATLGQSALATFWPKAQDLTQQILSLAQEILTQETPELAHSPIAVATTGSDSRLEKCGLGSPLELIIITPEKTLNPEQQGIIEKINCLCTTYSSLFYPAIEHKGLDQDHVSYYQEKTLIPTRAFDALLLAGNKDTFKSYKEKLCSELKTTKLKIFNKQFLERAYKELNKGALSNPLTGEIKYHKKGGRGAKHDILRVVQYSIALNIFFKVPQEKVTHIPPTILDRLSWLQKKGYSALSDQEYKTLLENYTQTSVWYAQLNALAQQHFGLDVVSLNICPKRLQQIIESTKQITKKIIGN